MVSPPLLLASLLTAAALFPVVAGAQAGAPPAAATVREPVQGGWNAEDLDRSARLLRGQGADGSQAGVQARFELFRSERNAALAHGQGTLKAADRVRLEQLSSALELTAPLSFEANLTRYYLQFPAPAAFSALDRAAEADADRAELLGPQLADAARRHDPQALKERALALKARGGIQPGLMQAADDLLLSVEPKAVLFVAGEMDAFPLWVRQYAEGQRKDLLVVDMRLLEDEGYRTAIWSAAGAKGAVPDRPDAFLQALVPSVTKRPVYLALSLGSERLAPFTENSYSTGLALKYSTRPVDNIPLLEQRWKRFNKPTDAGPLSRNYLLPASILLQHHRRVGNEAKAAELEYELRRFAKAIGSTQVLYTLGILEH